MMYNTMSKNSVIGRVTSVIVQTKAQLETDM
jgi:hypothetical protein